MSRVYSLRGGLEDVIPLEIERFQKVSPPAKGMGTSNRPCSRVSGPPGHCISERVVAASDLRLFAVVDACFDTQ